MRIVTDNFGALGPGVFEADITTGLTAILGPNGSGKSTLVEALYFSVTGELLRQGTIEDVISWGAATMSVELIGDDFSIKRLVTKGQPTKVWFKRGDVTLTRKTEVEEALMIRFGLIDKSAFKQIYFLEQFKAVSIFDAPDSARLAMLTTLFGFGRFEKARKALQDAANNMYTDKVDDELFSTLSTAVDTARSKLSVLESDMAAVKKLILDKDTISKVRDTASMLSTEQLKELESKAQTAAEAKQVCSDELSALPPDAGSALRVQLTEVENFQKLNTAFEEAEKKKEEFGAPVSPSCASISDLRNKLAVERSMLERDIAELNKRLNIVQGGLCPLTGGAPCSDLTAMTDPLTVNAEISKFKVKMDQLDADSKNLDTMFEEARAKEHKAAEVRAEYNRLRELILPQMELASIDVEELRKKVQEAEEVADKRKELSNKLQLLTFEANQKAAELDAAKAAGSVSAEEIAEAVNTAEQHDRALIIFEELYKRKEEAEQILASAKDSLSKAEEQNKRAELGTKIKGILTKARSVLHKDCLPRQLIDSFKDEINIKQAQYLDWFNFKYSVSWGSGGSLTYKNELGEDVPVTMLSGGQKYVLLIAFRCALADVFRSRFPLIVMDEPTTGLDVDSREQLALILPRIADVLGDRGVSVLIPTHDSVLLPTANIVSVI